jgi:hypothetical protein
VNQSRDDLLADAALTGDQHLGIGAGGMMHFLFDTPDSGTDAHHDNWLVHLRASAQKTTTSSAWEPAREGK